MTHPKMIFVSDDSRLRDGKLDPVDEEVLRQAGGGGKVFQMSSEEALAMAEAEAGKKTKGKTKGKTKPRRSAVEREVRSFVSERPAGTSLTPNMFGAGPPAAPRNIGPAPDKDGLLRLSGDDLTHLANAAALTWELFQKEVRAAMTDERAEYVRKLRVERKYTWRSVARACSNAWGIDWGSNQLAGMCLCEAAAERFFENYRQPPWN